MAVFFESELDCVATFWRIYRRDGVTLGFTSHDRPIRFDGICHLASPGLMPTAIRRTDELQGDETEVNGALSHSTISANDLASGRFDAAVISIGAVNWETLEREIFYSGQIGAIEDDGTAFSAELLSAKAELEKDLVPRTSPTCRASFCGPHCGLSEPKFSSITSILSFEMDANAVELETANPDRFVDGQIRFLDGALAGIRFGIMGASGQHFVLDKPLPSNIAGSVTAIIREGCDHTAATCASRFANSKNFRGEPFLPGNDLLARYPTSQ